MYKLKSRVQKMLFSVLMSSIIIIGGIVSVPNAAASPIKIMPVGDSCTAGMGDPNMGSYRTDLYNYYKNAGLSIDFVGSQKGGPSTLPDRDNEGHSGWMIPQIASNINAWLNTYNPDVVLLWIGGNDAILGNNINTTGLSNLIDQILNLKPQIRIFVSDYYPVPDKIKEYNVTIPGVVKQKADAGKKVYFVKLSDMPLNKSTDISSDGLHLNPTGYSKIAKIWYDSTISVLRSMSEPEILYGDLNGDKNINSTDLALMKRYIIGSITEFPVPSKAADLDGNGSINSIDYSLLNRYLLQLITDFPVNAK
ncbi:lysophospholipase L1-like esterase [Anaerobacterium chartisolvens]|uniref:Lysophospholipase L1-like esterase n=1 Tax=Anaerobacterium chartisolvens TaxID=1297424 RepID=A0A369B7T7_9FIRM|nr:dockerin type I domain-containing protein [Anaerobacterium chartisolvens]RCX17589.1 lysophospholipase L1-like esterase [Anaerobacterium chartisolvens]